MIPNANVLIDVVAVTSEVFSWKVFLSAHLQITSSLSTAPSVTRKIMGRLSVIEFS